MADRKPPVMRDFVADLDRIGKGDGRVQITGLRDLAKALKAVEGGVADLKAVNLEAAELVAQRAEDFAPVRSGNLRDTVRAAGQQSFGVVRAGNRGDVPYAAPIHWGWGTRPNAAKGWRGGPIAPNPFLYDAADERRDEVIETYERALGRLITDNF
jgi:hypothetical protein